jgi:hypothetical protein
MVNEATRNRNFNTKITEWIGKDRKSRVNYKSVRSINAGEEIGTKYSSDGTYWSNREFDEESKVFLDENNSFIDE